ncbi:copper amine oxidase N-terminal domain-containing protein [Caldalkalibacillus mannanilyticus]|uniref:copper amine oxidase N-terminal domain-containing protein n=1 Tax=Caldalkalibacillus mannanilyticus TaxID=1418 RepID=UPI00046A3BC3|nr:copper amine oxidase N-terminal domain-containing protein [Caldalkalibacillus mannanilyticus]
MKRINKFVALLLGIILVLNFYPNLLIQANGSTSQQSFVNKMVEEYDSYQKETQLSYQSFESTEKKNYDAYYKKQNEEYLLFHKQVSDDFSKIEQKIDEDIQALDKKYGKNPSYRDALDEYKKAADKHRTNSPMRNYYRAIDQHVTDSPMRNYYRAIDQHVTDSPMRNYYRAIDQHVTDSPMRNYYRAIDQHVTDSPMRNYYRAVDQHVTGSPMRMYIRGEISQSEAEKRINKQKETTKTDIQDTEKRSKAVIEQTTLRSTQSIEKTQTQSLTLIMKQRESTIDALSTIRKKHFDEGLTFEPLVLQSKEIKVMINGQLQSYTQPPTIIEGTTLVPLRGIFEELEATVLWNSKDRSITVSKDDIQLFLQVNNTQAKVNEKTIKLDLAPRVINGSTMVPLRFISEALGATVRWDGNTRTIWITTEE